MAYEQLKRDPERSEKLKVASPDRVKSELDLRDPSAVTTAPSQNQELEAMADRFVGELMSFDLSKPEEQQTRKESVEQMGIETQRRAAKQSELLRQPIKKLSQTSEDGGEVANAMIDLKMKVEELDPSKFDFEPGWFSRALGSLPGVGTPLKRYFSRYESAQAAIASIIRSLESGRDQLLRDNVTLTEDQKQMRAMTHKLERAIQLGQLIDQKLQYKLDREIPAEDPKHKFVAEELLFPLRQRIIDLQQQLAVNQQGVLAVEIIIRNNKELARGVNRALNVTVSALEVGATVAMALANQKIVLDKITSVNQTTSSLIAGTAARLKTQGVEIHKQASSSQLSMESLKSAFADIQAAMNDVSNFRTQALPQMAQSILELDQLSSEAEAAIRRMEEGKKARPSIQIEVEDVK